MTKELLCVLACATGVACGSSDNGDDAGTGGVGPALGTGGAITSSGGSMAAVSGGAPSSASGGMIAAAGSNPMGMGGSVPPGSGGASGSGAVTGMGGSGNGGGAGSVSSGGTAGAVGAGGASGAAGAAGSNTGGAGAGGDDPCAGGTSGPASDASGSKTRVSGYGGVQLTTSTKTHITSLETTLIVPAKPTPGGTLFLWPGLEPLNGSANYNPIGTGVLQPVLTWGGTCAPTAPNNYDDWWISGQYVNTLGSAQGFTGCKGGTGMTVSVGDNLHILMALNGTTWSQTNTDDKNGKKATFDIDLKGQAQNWVIFSIEAPSGKQPVSDVIFTSTVVTTLDSDPSACTPSVRGTTDYFSSPRASTDGKRCCISKIILRGQGVPASGPNN
jgi:hypothetical protein